MLLSRPEKTATQSGVCNSLCVTLFRDHTFLVKSLQHNTLVRLRKPRGLSSGCAYDIFAPDVFFATLMRDGCVRIADSSQRTSSPVPDAL